MATLDDSGELTKMEVVDFNNEYASFEFANLPDGLLAKLFLQAYDYRATLLFPPLSLDIPTEDPSNRLLTKMGENRSSLKVENTTKTLRYLSSSPAEAWIFLTECLQNVDPTELKVTASSDGNTFPLKPERSSGGFYKAKFSVAESEIADDVVGFACDGIELAGKACPFVIGE